MGKTPIRYKEETSAEFGAKAAQTWQYRFEPEKDPDLVVLQGACPKCDDGTFVYEWPLTLVLEYFRTPSGVDTAGRQVDDIETESIPVICRCRTTHPGSQGERGCGRSWTLQVPRP